MAPESTTHHISEGEKKKSFACLSLINTLDGLLGKARTQNLI